MYSQGKKKSAAGFHAGHVGMSLDHYSSSSSQKNLQHSDSNKFDQITINGGDHHQPDQTVKKLNHNASERDRRKNINGLYSSLRSLLPPSDHTV